MVDDVMLKVAEAEVTRLEAELEKTPAYQRLQAAKNVIEVYRRHLERSAGEQSANQAPELSTKTADAAPQQQWPWSQDEIAPATKTAQVDAAAAEYLTIKGRRATSGEILPYVMSKNIEITGAIPAKTLASYLSRSKRFDNVQGFGGFGLVEWHGRRGAPAPAPSNPAPNNEIIHDSGKLPLNS